VRVHWRAALCHRLTRFRSNLTNSGLCGLVPIVSPTDCSDCFYDTLPVCPSPPPPSPLPPRPPPPSPPPDTVTPTYLTHTITLGGYTIASFGTYQATQFCAAVKNATGAANCTVTGVQASSRRHLSAAGVTVAYTLRTTPALQAAVTAVMTNSVGPLSTLSTFSSAGLSAVTSTTPSSTSVTPSAAAPPGATTLPITVAPGQSGACGSRPVALTVLLALAAGSL